MVDVRFTGWSYVHYLFMAFSTYVSSNKHLLLYEFYFICYHYRFKVNKQKIKLIIAHDSSLIVKCIYFTYY